VPAPVAPAAAAPVTAPASPATVPTTAAPTAPSTVAARADQATSTTAELVELHASPARQLGSVDSTGNGRRRPAVIGALLVALVAFGVAGQYRRATTTD
jgi:hypothetical protein